MQRELSEEISQHLDEAMDALVAKGMSQDEARRVSHVAFGNRSRVEEQGRNVWRWPRVEQLWHELRLSLRRQRQTPGVALTAIFTLALGIGAPTTLFAVLDAVLLQPLPFAHPSRLVEVRTVPDGITSIPTVEDWQAHSHSFASLAAYRQWSPEQIAVKSVHAERILEVTQNFFSTLGTGLAQGHLWATTGNESDCTRQVVVSGQFWHRLGGGALGHTSLQLDGRAFPITGVLPAEQKVEGLTGAEQTDAFVQLGCDSQAKPYERGDSGFQVLGRMLPGINVAAAQANLQQIDTRLRAEYPRDYAPLRAGAQSPEVLPYAEWIVGVDTTTTLYASLTACGLLLAIACANLANLLLARAIRRRDELALRMTLGATLRQLLRQMLVENAVLVVLGTAGGLGLAFGALRLLHGASSLHLPRLSQAALHLPVLAFAVSMAAVVTVAITILPARRLLRPDLLRDFAGASRSSATGSLRQAGRMLVIAQLSLTFVLLACAGWLISSVWMLLHQPLGFDPSQLLMTHVQFSSYHSNQNAAEGEHRIEDVEQTLRALPGVTAVAATDHEPLGHAVNRFDFASDAHPSQWTRPVTLNPNSFAISPGYFAAIGQTVLVGRDFRDTDDGGNPVAIVNQALAAREWPGQSALGHQIRSGELQAVNRGWATVVGVVGNAHNFSLETTPEPDIYVPRSQDPSGYAILAVRVKGNAGAMSRTVEAVLRKVFPDASSRWAEPMDEVLSQGVAQRTFLMDASAAFAGSALLLAILGTYGLLTYELSLREKEIGIRLALGSPRDAIVTLVVRQEGRWLVLGSLLGLACAALAGWVLRSRFYDPRGTALPVLAASALLLLTPALLAIVLPSRKAAAADPAILLRRE